MVLGLLYRPFKGQRPQERPKSFLAFGSRAAAEMGRLQWLCVLCSTVSARARALPLPAGQDRRRGYRLPETDGTRNFDSILILILFQVLDRYRD